MLSSLCKLPTRCISFLVEKDKSYGTNKMLMLCVVLRIAQRKLNMQTKCDVIYSWVSLYKKSALFLIV